VNEDLRDYRRTTVLPSFPSRSNQQFMPTLNTNLLADIYTAVYSDHAKAYSWTLRNVWNSKQGEV